MCPFAINVQQIYISNQKIQGGIFKKIHKYCIIWPCSFDIELISEGCFMLVQKRAEVANKEKNKNKNFDGQSTSEEYNEMSHILAIKAISEAISGSNMLST